LANRTIRNLIEIEGWTELSSFLRLSPMLERRQDVLPRVTSDSCQCTLRDRFPRRLRYGVIGGSSEIQLAPDSYRVSFSPTGYLSWDLAYKSALLRCAELTIKSGYRYFGVVAIEGYSSANSFGIPKNSYAHRFYKASTVYNPPHSLSISYWLCPLRPLGCSESQSPA